MFIISLQYIFKARDEYKKIQTGSIDHYLLVDVTEVFPPRRVLVSMTDELFSEAGGTTVASTISIAEGIKSSIEHFVESLLRRH